MSIDRYDCNEDGMGKYHQGDYVLFSDYKEEIDSLKDEVSMLREAIKEAINQLNV